MKKLMTLAVGSLCLAAAGTQAAMAAPATQPRINDCQADPTDDVMPFTDFEAMLMRFQDMVDDHRFRYAGNVDYDVYERLVQYPILVAVEAFFNGEALEAYGAYNSMVQSGQHNAAVIERVQDAERQMKQYFDTYNLGCSRYENFHNQYLSLLAYSKVVEELGAEIYATYNLTAYPNCPQFEIKNYQEVFNQFVMRRGIVQDQLNSQKALMQAGITEDFKEWADAQLALYNFQTSVAGCYDILNANKESLQEALETMESNASPSDADAEFYDQWSVRAAQLNAQLNANMEKLKEYRDQYDAGMRNAQLYFDVLSRFQDLTAGIQRDQYQLFSVDIEAAYATGRLAKENDALLQRFNDLKQRNDAFAQQLNQAWADVANYAEVKDGIEALKSNFSALLLKIAEAVYNDEALYTPYAKRGDEIATRLRLIGKNADDIMAAGVFSNYYEELISEVRNIEFDINKLAADFDKAKQSTMSDYDRFQEHLSEWSAKWWACFNDLGDGSAPAGVNKEAYTTLKGDYSSRLWELYGTYNSLNQVSKSEYNSGNEVTLAKLDTDLEDCKRTFYDGVEALKRAAQTDGTDVLASIRVAAEELLAVAAQYQERLNVLEHYNLTPLVQLYSDMQEDIVAAQTYAESVKAKGGVYVAEEEAKFDLGSLSYMKDQLAERFNSFMTKWNVLAQNASLQAEISYKVHDVRSTVDNAYWKVVNYQIPEGVSSTQPFEELIQQYSASIRQLYETLSDCVNTIDSNMLTQLGLQSMSDSADTALAQTEALLKSFENVWKQTLQYYASSDLLNFLDLRDKVSEEAGYCAGNYKTFYEKIDMENDPDKKAALQTLQERYYTIYLLLNDMQSYLELARQEGRYDEAYHKKQTAYYEDLVAQVKQAEASCQAVLDGYGTTVDADRLPALLELDRLMMIEVQQGSETLNQSRVPESLNGTKVGANLEDYVSTALGGYKELVSALAAEVDYNVRDAVANGSVSQKDYDKYVAQIYAVKAQAEDYVLKFAETWAVLCEKGQQLVATQADLDALEMEINVAIAELKQRLEALNANSQHKAPARIDGDALSGERKAIVDALASYNALLAKVQQAKNQLSEVEYTLYYPERVDASTFAPVPALVAECRQSREQLRQIRDIYKYNMEEAGVSMDFDADAFYATRGALRNYIDHFILMLNDNLADGESFSDGCVNFSDHHVMQQAKGTPIFGLFWQMNNDAQREYTPRYCYAAAEVLAESSQLSNEELALRADEFLSRLYTLKTAAQAYEKEWWNRFYTYSEDIYQYHNYSVRMSGFNDKLDAAEAYFNSLVVNPNDPNAEELNKVIADYKARLQDIRNQAQDISNGIYRPESFEEFEAACEAFWSLEDANTSSDTTESVIDVLLRDFRGTYANESRGELPHIDLDTLWANLNSAADEIDRFVYMLNNEYFVPAGIEGSYIYNALWQFNNDVQDEYIQRFRDPASNIIRTARSYEREGKLDGLYEQAPIFMQQILDIKTYADDYVNDPNGYKYQYQQMLNEAYDYIALKQGIAELREECQKTQAEMQAYLADVTGVGADARQMLERYVEDGVMGMAAMLEQLAELELEVLNMEDGQMLEQYKDTLQGLRDEYYKRHEGFLNGWREVTGSLPGQVTAALFAEFLEFYQKADALQSVCQTSIAVAEAQLKECPSDDLSARLQTVVFRGYNPAREALVRVMVEANAAQAMGNFTQEYIERVKVAVDQFNSVVNECNNIAALIKQYQALLGEADAFIAAGNAKYQELAALSETAEGEVADMQRATAYECNALASQVITFKAEFQYDWMETGDVEELMENFRNMLTKMKQEYDAALAKYEYFMSEREFGNSTADELLYVINAQIDLNKNATMECFSEEYEMLYNADLLCRCETYEGLRDTYTKMFAVNEASLNQLRAAMEESQQKGTFVLDAEGFKARIRKSDAYRRATVEQFNKDMSLLADKMEAERRMRYGIVEDTKQYDELLYINTYVANAGENVTVPVNVKNDYAMSSISFTVEVPEEAMGYIPTVSNYVNVTTDERTNYCSVNVAYSETYNTVDVIITPAVGATIPAGDGTVVNIEMANVAVGDYPVMVNNVAYVDTNGNVVTVDKVYGTVRAVDVESFGEADSETVAEVVEDITSEVVSYTAYARDEPIRPDDDPSQRADSRRRAAATPSDPAAAHRALLEKYDVNGDGRLTIGDITTYIRLMTEKSKK